MSNFIAKFSIADFLSNFKVSEFEHELEPGDFGTFMVLQVFFWPQHVVSRILQGPHDSLMPTQSISS